MARPSKPTETPIASPVTFTPEQLQAFVDQAVAKVLAVKAADKAASKSDQSNKNELKAVAAFKKKGFGILKPHTDIKTFNKWVAEGLRPREGEHAVPVANLRLFARSQCRPLTKQEAGEFAAKAKEREAKATAKTTAKVIPITEQPSA
jgi:hypothetical protein